MEPKDGLGRGLRPGRTRIKTRPRASDLEPTGCHVSAWKCTGSPKAAYLFILLSQIFFSVSPFPVYFFFHLDPSCHVIIGSFQAPQIFDPFLVLSSPFLFNFQHNQKKYEIEPCLISSNRFNVVFADVCLGSTMSPHHISSHLRSLFQFVLPVPARL